jgi:hypothetical protein
MILTEPKRAEQGRMQQPINQPNIMQNYCKTIGALAAASALVAGNASAIEIDYEIHGGYTSEYIWRGIDLGNDLVEGGINASTEVSGFGLSAGAWYASYEAQINGVSGPPFNTMDADELDLYAEASYDLGFVNVAVGYIYYQFNQGRANTILAPLDDAQELYVSLSRDFGMVDVYATYYGDIESDNDGYTEFGASNETELTDCLTLSSGLALGYLVEEGDFVHLTAKVALDYAFTETATLSPFVGYALSLSEGGTNHVGTSLYTGATNQFFAGCMLTVGF